MWKIGSAVLNKTEILPIQPAYDSIFNCKYKQLYERKEKKTIKPFDFRMEAIPQESAISVTNVHKSILPQVLPWIIIKPQIILGIKQTPQDKNTSQHYKSLRKIIKVYIIHIYFLKSQHTQIIKDILS